MDRAMDGVFAVLDELAEEVTTVDAESEKRLHIPS
jgi:hypothetical protein